MATWQPPIPSGALYSKAARALGPALPLLAYCYDKVKRDGWFEISLKEVASDMDESYQTIKRHWWALKDGPFFVETVDQGRKGWRVRFKDVWLDWRILAARQTEDRFSRSDKGTKDDLEDMPETTNEGTKENLQDADVSENTAQGHFKVISRSNEGTPRDLETSGNKVLMITDQAGVECADAAAPRAPQKRSRKEQPPTPLPIREALAGVCHIGKLSTREQHLQLNQSAAAIWRAQSAQGHDAETIAADIRYVADYFAKNDWRGKKGDIPRPADIRANWQAAMDARASPPLNPGANIPVFHGSDEPPPAPRRKTLEELDEIFFKANGHYPKRRLNA